MAVLLTVVVAGLATGVPAEAAPIPATAHSSTSPLGAWSVLPTQNPGAKDQFRGLSCLSATFCMGVGFTKVADGPKQTLAELWDGTTWSLTDTPNTSPDVDNQLFGVSCVSTDFCLSVGQVVNPSTTDALIEMWDGTSWSLVKPPATGPDVNQTLNGISCLSTTFCVAVGQTATTDVTQTLVLQWNGTAWSTTSSPDTSPSDPNGLQAVACTSAAWCMAVGQSNPDNKDPSDTLTEQWNGTAWSIVPSPTTAGPHADRLSDVACTSPTFCLAVGYTQLPDSSYEGLILRWNGTTWAMQPRPVVTPATGAGVTGVGDGLLSISCIGPATCVASGAILTEVPPNQAASTGASLVLSWNGATWSQQPVPNPGTAASQSLLYGVDCHAGSACLAVGAFQVNSLNTSQAFAVRAPLETGGYDLVAADGGIFSFGDAGFFGSTGSLTLNQPIVGMATTPDGKGYWLVAADGGVFAFGDAGFFGSTGSLTLNRPIVGMAATPDGKGYWLVAADGGVFSFGDAAFYGSTGSLTLNRPIVAMAADPTGAGYWLVAADGGIFSFGDAAFYGSTGSLTLNQPIEGMAASPTGSGYWLVAADGGVFNFGDAQFFGSTGSVALRAPIVGLAPSATGLGYWLVGADGGIFNFGDASFFGSAGSLVLNKPIVGMAAG